jgi:hypothetical protein
MAVHEQGRVSELVADHASVVTSVVFKCDMVVFYDHGRIKVRYLLLVFDSV